MNIVIVGRGNLATSIADRCLKEKVSYSFWEDKKINKKSVILYCGSERLFKEVCDFCRIYKTPLILLSTSIKHGKKYSFLFLPVPNSSREVQNFLSTVIQFAQQNQYNDISILESHQKSKKDISGTALMIAKKLGESVNIITSIRDPKKQIKIGIPSKHLGGHAYHKITFIHEGIQTEFSILVFGRETYAKGAINMAREILKRAW